MKKPYIILLGGRSASGKSTIAEKIKEELNSYCVYIIHMDEYYKKAEDRPLIYGISDGKSYIDDNVPEAFDMDRCYQDLRKMSDADVDVILVEGIFALHESRFLQVADLKLYVDCDSDECFSRRIKRHLGFGQTPEEITERYVQAVVPRQRELVIPSKWKADLILNGFAEAPIGMEIIKKWIESIK